MKKTLGFLVIAVCTHATAYELDPIIYSSKTETKASELTSSVTVIDAKEITEGGNARVTDVLKNVSGIEVSETGVITGQTSVFIRGGEGRHTVIMVDGVKVYDPTTITRTMDASYLNLVDIEKIEVLKGPQSVLYGSDAIAGVVNIITKKGSAKNKVKLGAGITRDAGLVHTFKFDKGLVNFSGHYQDTNEFSDAVDGEKDLKINKGFTLTSDFNFGKLDSQTIVKMTESYNEVDGQNFTTNLPVDQEDVYRRDLQSLVSQKLTYNSGKTKRILDLSLNRYERLNKHSFGESYFDGSSTNIEYRAVRERKNGKLVTGIQEESETYRDSAMSATTKSSIDIYANRILEYGSHHFEVGTRLTKSVDFGEHLIYNLGVKKDLTKEFSVYISNKTGFKSPSTYQLFGEYNGTLYGNEDLTPEKSTSYELGGDYKTQTLSSGFAFFQNEVENFIGFENNRYTNIDGAITRGFEGYSNLSIGKSELGLNISLIGYDLSTGDKAVRRPSHSANLFYNYNLSDTHNFGTKLRYRGVRYGIKKADFRELDPYTVMDLNYVYSQKAYKFIGAIKNVFDTDYETAIDYEVQGLGAQANIEYYY